MGDSTIRHYFGLSVSQVLKLPCTLHDIGHIFVDPAQRDAPVGDEGKHAPFDSIETGILFEEILVEH